MKQSSALFLTTVMLLFVGCGDSRKTIAFDKAENLPSPKAEGARMSVPVAQSPMQQGRGQGSLSSYFEKEQPTLDKASSAQALSQALDRKIIRNAEMTIEIDSPNDGQRKIASIAEKHGGFVVTSESKESLVKTQAAPSKTVTVVARVPAAKFGGAVDEIHGIGGRILHEKISGQDVTEEFIDLEARIRAKRALEMQFLEIMKQARKVSDALEVQTQLTEVRTEIERLEGRRRFIENQSALSTITITLQTPAPLVAATTKGFFSEIKMAFGDGLDTANEIVLGIIRFVLVMIPVTVFILLPCWFLFKWLRHRIEWPRKPAPAVSVTNETT